VVAVLLAAQKLENYPKQKVVFLIDSQSVILAMSKNSDTECPNTFVARSQPNAEGWHTAPQSITGHVDICGNGKADHPNKIGRSRENPLVPEGPSKKR